MHPVIYLTEILVKTSPGDFRIEYKQKCPNAM
jgi:hypothetical protein